MTRTLNQLLNVLLQARETLGDTYVKFDGVDLFLTKDGKSVTIELFPMVARQLRAGVAKKGQTLYIVALIDRVRKTIMQDMTRGR